MRAYLLVSGSVLGSLLLAACSSGSGSPTTTKHDSGTTFVDSGTTTSAGDDSAVSNDTGSTSLPPPSDSGGTTTSDTGGGASETGSETGGITDCNPHPGDECNLVTQAPCTGSTPVCAYDDTSKHNKCVSTAAIGGVGAGLAGTTCKAQSDCDQGLFCENGYCTPACCSGDNSPCGAGGECNLILTDGSTPPNPLYSVCSYSAICHAFQYDCPTGQVCLFSMAPDTFKCSAPSSGAAGLGTKPGGACNYINDCGESQICVNTSLPDGGISSTGTCALVCQLTGSPMVGSTPGGRFPANGTCKVGGVEYPKAGATCVDVSGSGIGLSGGYGLCQ
jgi:hypothetical protein